MLKPKLIELNQKSLIHIMGIIEAFGWNIYIHGNSECYITKDSPNDFSELKNINYMYFEVKSENIIKVGIKLINKEISFFDDFCKKNILISNDDVRIYMNNRTIIFHNMTNASVDEKYVYKRRSI